MVYLRWIRKKNGTMSGPYLYKSIRVGKAIVGKYIGKANSSDIKKYKNKIKVNRK